MTPAFFAGQLRLAMVAFFAYAGGRGWLTPQDAGFATAMITAVGPLVLPWAWSIYTNINKKLVPHDAIAIAGDTPHSGAPAPGLTISLPANTAKVVG